MYKLFLLEGEEKSISLEVLTAYIMPVLKHVANVVVLNTKEQQLLHLDTLPCLIHDSEVITDCEKIVTQICKISQVDSLIMKEPEIWPLANSFLTEAKALGSAGVLDKLKTTLGDKKFLITNHITLADIFAGVQGIRALREVPDDKILDWVSVYKWAQNLLNLPFISVILDAKTGGLKNIDDLLTKNEKKEEGKHGEENKGGKMDKAEKKRLAKEKAKKEAKEKSKEPESNPFGQLDWRVGKIVSVEKHPDSTKLYKEKIDIGGEIRDIASGLQEHVTLEEMQDRHVVVFCNLKAKSLAGFMSHGMIVCASNADHSKIELLIPPEGTKPGDPVVLEGVDRTPAAELNLSKKNNPWSKIEKQLTTNDDLVLVLDGKELKVGGGVIKSKTLKGATIS